MVKEERLISCFVEQYTAFNCIKNSLTETSASPQMKRIQLINLLFLASLVFSLGACKTSSDVVSSNWIQKRKYTKGFYVANKAKTDTHQAEAEAAVKNPEVNSEAKAASEVTLNAPVETIAQIESPSKPVQTEKLSQRQRSTATLKDEQASPAEKATLLNLSPLEGGIATNDIIDITEFIDQSAEKKPIVEVELIIMVVMAIVIPPAAVFVMFGVGKEFLISILLTILFILPGILYALYHVTQNY